MKKLITSFYGNLGDGYHWYEGQTYENHQRYAESIGAEYRFFSGEEFLYEYVPGEVRDFLLTNLDFKKNSWNYTLMKPFVPVGCYIDPDIYIYNPKDVFEFYDPNKICLANEWHWHHKNTGISKIKHLDALNTLQPVKKRIRWNTGLFLYS